MILGKNQQKKFFQAVLLQIIFRTQLQFIIPYKQQCLLLQTATLY